MSESIDEPVLPTRAEGDSDAGWGDPSERDRERDRDADLLRDRPPHW